MSKAGNQKKKKAVKYPVISLFSGAMGLDLGFEMGGLDVLVSQDFDASCVKTMEANERTQVAGDIRKLLHDDPKCNFLLKAAHIARNEVFAVIGGPPCQSFSTAGKRLGTNDPRGGLFLEFSKTVRALRPRFFVMENVKGLISAAVSHRPLSERSNGTQLSADEQPGTVFSIIKKEFEALGYKIIAGVLDAVHYGVPQFRERLIIIGSRDGEDIFLPIPTHFQSHQDPDRRWRTLRDSISDLEDSPGPCLAFSADRIELLKLVPMGGSWRNLPKELIQKAMGGAYNSGGGKVGFFRRLDYNQPSPTLVTSPVQKATMLCHPTKDRPLSVSEYSRIQQFPDSWKFEGNINNRYRQIGNAVPVGLGKAIGQSLISVAEKSTRIQTKRTRGTSVHERVLAIQDFYK